MVLASSRQPLKNDCGGFGEREGMAGNHGGDAFQRLGGDRLGGDGVGNQPLELRQYGSVHHALRVRCVDVLELVNVQVNDGRAKQAGSLFQVPLQLPRRVEDAELLVLIPDTGR